MTCGNRDTCQQHQVASFVIKRSRQLTVTNKPSICPLIEAGQVHVQIGNRSELSQRLRAPWRSPAVEGLGRVPGFGRSPSSALISTELSTVAEEMDQKKSEGLQSILGPDTYSSMNNLANVLRPVGRSRGDAQNSIGRQAEGPWTRPCLQQHENENCFFLLAKERPRARS